MLHSTGTPLAEVDGAAGEDGLTPLEPLQPPLPQHHTKVGWVGEWGRWGKYQITQYLENVWSQQHDTIKEFIQKNNRRAGPGGIADEGGSRSL